MITRSAKKKALENAAECHQNVSPSLESKTIRNNNNNDENNNGEEDFSKLDKIENDISPKSIPPSPIEIITIEDENSDNHGDDNSSVSSDLSFKSAIDDLSLLEDNSHIMDFDVQHHQDIDNEYIDDPLVANHFENDDDDDDGKQDDKETRDQNRIIHEYFGDHCGYYKKTAAMESEIQKQSDDEFETQSNEFSDDSVILISDSDSENAQTNNDSDDEKLENKIIEQSKLESKFSNAQSDKILNNKDSFGRPKIIYLNPIIEKSDNNNINDNKSLDDDKQKDQSFIFKEFKKIPRIDHSYSKIHKNNSEEETIADSDFDFPVGCGTHPDSIYPKDYSCLDDLDESEDFDFDLIKPEVLIEEDSEAEQYKSSPINDHHDDNDDQCLINNHQNDSSIIEYDYSQQQYKEDYHADSKKQPQELIKQRVIAKVVHGESNNYSSNNNNQHDNQIRRKEIKNIAHASATTLTDKIKIRPNHNSNIVAAQNHHQSSISSSSSSLISIKPIRIGQTSSIYTTSNGTSLISVPINHPTINLLNNQQSSSTSKQQPTTEQQQQKKFVQFEKSTYILRSKNIKLLTTTATTATLSVTTNSTTTKPTILSPVTILKGAVSSTSSSSSSVSTTTVPTSLKNNNNNNRPLSKSISVSFLKSSSSLTKNSLPQSNKNCSTNNIQSSNKLITVKSNGVAVNCNGSVTPKTNLIQHCPNNNNNNSSVSKKYRLIPVSQSSSTATKITNGRRSLSNGGNKFILIPRSNSTTSSCNKTTTTTATTTIKNKNTGLLLNSTDNFGSINVNSKTKKIQIISKQDLNVINQNNSINETKPIDSNQENNKKPFGSLLTKEFRTDSSKNKKLKTSSSPEPESKKTTSENNVGTKIKPHPLVIKYRKPNGEMATTLAVMFNGQKSNGSNNDSDNNSLNNSSGQQSSSSSSSSSSTSSNKINKFKSNFDISTMFNTAVLAGQCQTMSTDNNNDNYSHFLPNNDEFFRKSHRLPVSLQEPPILPPMTAGVSTPVSLRSLSPSSHPTAMFNAVNEFDALKFERECVNCGTQNTSQWRTNGNGNYLCNACGLYKKYNGEDRPPASIQQPRKRTNQQPKQCSNCGTLTSSMWRRTANKQVACNACGLYYKLYGINRPLEMRKDIVYPRNRYSKLNGVNGGGQGVSGTNVGGMGSKPKNVIVHHMPSMPNPFYPKTNGIGNSSSVLGQNYSAIDKNDSLKSSIGGSPKAFVISAGNKMYQADLNPRVVCNGGSSSSSKSKNYDDDQPISLIKSSNDVILKQEQEKIKLNQEIKSEISSLSDDHSQDFDNDETTTLCPQVQIKSEADSDEELTVSDDHKNLTKFTKSNINIFDNNNNGHSIDDSDNNPPNSTAFSPFQSLLELSAMNANNPTAVQTQTALMSAILQSGAFSLDPAGLQSLFCNPALAALQTFNLNGFFNMINQNGGTIGGSGNSNSSTASLKSANIKSNNFDEEKPISNGRPVSQECANCGALGSTTQLKRYGSSLFLHYLCSPCANKQCSDSSTNSSLSSGRKAKSRDVQCSNCGVTQSSEWRRNVRGEIVCNACGLYYKLHQRDRPIHMRRDFIAHRKRTPNNNTTPKTNKNNDVQTPDSNTPSIVKSEDESQTEATNTATVAANVIRLITGGQSQLIPCHLNENTTSNSTKDQESATNSMNLSNQEISDYYSETENTVDNDDSQSSEHGVNRLKRSRSDDDEEFDESLMSGANSPSCHSVASVSSNETENTTSSSHSATKKRKQSNPKKYIKTENDSEIVGNNSETNEHSKNIVKDENNSQTDSK